MKKLRLLYFTISLLFPFFSYANSGENFNTLIHQINTYLTHYNQFTGFEYRFIALDSEKLGLSLKEIEEIKQEEFDFSTLKDSIESYSLIEIYQEKIVTNLEAILKHKKLKINQLNSLFNKELVVISSLDNKLFNFCLDEKTGGTYRSKISLIYSTITDSIYRDDFFEPNGYFLIDTLNTKTGVKYLMQGFVRGCSYCFSNHISLVDFNKGKFKLDFHYGFDSRDWNDEISIDSSKRMITTAYHLNDLSETCSCESDSEEESNFDYDEKKSILCSCKYTFNGETFELLEKKEQEVLDNE